ncbi:MAG TPA: CDP-diacylglycerol--serine O-phosphatidyltransferase [Pirellulales bacterium]|jgi:CDP-diacylglycerol--serine O-phosphatidyltransferase|nr:CDP-diacylglycerol--serine O-phosphatidyltransferase [Pirellulales bacterium]
MAEEARPGDLPDSPAAERLLRRKRKRLKFLSMRRIRTVAILPTLFTLGNVVCGFFAIVVAARIVKPTAEYDVSTPAANSATTNSLVANPAAGDSAAVANTSDARLAEARASDLNNVMLSAWLIFLAMIFDALDGHVARLARTTSDFGAQLDSLCDAVTFGVAPGFLMVKMCPQFTYLHAHTPWIIAATYTVCAVLRLARFNVESNEDDDHLKFKGLPSPAAAGSIAGFAIFFYTLRDDQNAFSVGFRAGLDVTLQHALPWFTLAVAALMVSQIPYPHLINQLFSGRRSFSHLVGVVFSLVAIMVVRGYAVPIVCMIFVLGPPARFFWEKWYQHKEGQEPLF